MKETQYRITALDAGFIRIDGGQLFGILPKREWGTLVQADSENRVTLPARVLLVETPSCNILFDTGPGHFCAGPAEACVRDTGFGSPLSTALAARGIAPKQISHIFLSHLHYNTAGSLFPQLSPGGPLPYKNAKIHISQAAIQRACSPHLTDEALFIPGTGPLLESSPALTLISGGQQMVLDGISITCMETWGHSPGMMIFRISRYHRHLITGADLLPGMPWTDIRVCSNLEWHPERLAEEKQEILSLAAKQNAWIFYPHDLHSAFSRIRLDHRTDSHMPVQVHRGPSV